MVEAHNIRPISLTKSLQLGCKRPNAVNANACMTALAGLLVSTVLADRDALKVDIRGDSAENRAIINRGDLLC